MTYRDIATKLGITGARVIQLHDHALRCLKHPYRATHLKEVKFQLKG